jgi:hypothetical protein
VETTLISKATIVIRSVGERTETLCKKLILEQGISSSAIHIVKEVPFSKAMKTSFEIGIAAKRPWTFCVDADLLLRPLSIFKMIQHAENQPENVCEIQGFVLDKFFGGIRKGGVHVYRTSLLDKVINEIPVEGLNIRPETHALVAMQKSGYPWKTVEELVGLHDFEQSYEDIYRKCFVHSHKHLIYTELFIPFWRSKISSDRDYQIALIGFAEGIKYFGDVRIDKSAKYFLDSMQDLRLNQKSDLNISDWDVNLVESIIINWKEPLKYFDYFPTGMLITKGNGFSKIYGKYRWFRKSRSVSIASKLLIGSLLKSIGNRLIR